MIGGVKPVTARWVRWVQNETRGSVRASRTPCPRSTTPPPPPRRRQRHRCPCGECYVHREFGFLDIFSFPAKATVAVGPVFGGLRGGEGARVRYRYHNRSRRTVDCWHSVLEASGKIWVFPVRFSTYPQVWPTAMGQPVLTSYFNIEGKYYPLTLGLKAGLYASFAP